MSPLLALMRSLRAVAVAYGVATFAAGCAPAEPPKPSFEIGVPAAATHLDPALHDGPAAALVARLVLQTLPQLARRIVPGDDRSPWRFELDPDARFSDGTVVDANAVLANVHRWPDAASFRSSAVDTHTVAIAVDGGRDLAALLRDPKYAIASPLAIADTSSFDRAPVGSGPYVVKSFDADSTIELVAASGAAHAYASIFIRPVLDGRSAILSLEKDDLDVMYGLPGDLLDEAKTHTIASLYDPSSGLWCAFAAGPLPRDATCPPLQARTASAPK